MDAFNTLQRLGQGRFMEDLAAELSTMSDAVVAGGPGSKGKVTVTFDIEQPKGAIDIAVVIRETFGKSLPKKAPKGAMFFAFGDELFTIDPRSPELPAFRRVETETPEQRAVEEKTAERTANK